MTKVSIRLPSLAGLLASATLVTACFTPEGFGAGIVVDEREAPVPGVEPAENGIIEGIVPGTEGRELEPPKIPFDPPFDGEPLSSKTLDSGVVVDEFQIGSGDPIADNKVVEFQVKGWAGLNATQIMGSGIEPSLLIVNETMRKRDPITGAMIEAMLGMAPGGKRRLKVPADLVMRDAPAGTPSWGDLWITVEVVSVNDAPVLETVEAYTGTPIASKKHDDGLEVYDYVAGEGPAAKSGNRVVTHYIGQLADGTEFDSSHGRAEGMSVVLGTPGVITGFAQGLEGARKGMLRKIVIPPELGYGDQERPKIPANSTLVFYLQIMDVNEPPADMGMMGGH